MKPEDLESLFTEYKRFNAVANKATEGTGIGLNITKSLVTLMGGTISVESEYGKGSIFTVTVRQQSVDCGPIGAELAEKLRNFTFSGNRQLSEMHVIHEWMPYGRVLIVDDVETNLYVAKGLLSPYGLKTETVDSGYAAIEKTEKGGVYDIIFMDHMMPEMDGIETTKKLRESGYTGVIVALTANALVGNDEMFKQNGFDDFIAKPIDIRQLNAVLNKYIRDRYPDEAKKSRAAEISNKIETNGINPKLIKIFCRGAEKAITVLRETMRDGNIELYTTTAQAMKSALQNIGQDERAALAHALEQAGLDGDTNFISINTESFLESLESLVNSLRAAE
jgi:CheY-like chemotaxis protein